MTAKQKPATHWDPIDGTISVTMPDASAIRKGIVLPQPIKRALPIAALAALGWTFVEGMFFGDFPFIPVAVTTVLFGAFFFAAELENAEGRKTLRRVALAERKGWTYTNTLMEPVMAQQAISTREGVDRRWNRVKSPRAEAVEQLVPELTQLKVGAFVGARFDGEFWGQSNADGLPFWLAIGSMPMEAGLATNRELRRDAYGGTGGFGVFFSLLGAYRLDRSTGIRAAIRPEGLFNKGPLDRDVKTESAEFNAAYNISGRRKDGENSDLDHEILRILTPATQASMLDLQKRYHNTGFIVDDDVLFFMAQDKLVGKNAHPDRVDVHLTDMAETFERAKFGLKRYVE